MTRRIVIAIVLNVWLVLITAGASTYFITRALLIADLDETIVSRVMSLPGIERPAFLSRSTPDVIDRDISDRWVMKGPDGRVLNPLTVSAANPPRTAPPPIIETRGFSRLANGSWLRTLQVRALAQHISATDTPEQVTVIYSASADHIEALLNRLLYSLSFFAVLAALATAFAAFSVARAALKPVRDTVEVIGAIDERSLNRRIATEKLPSELVPVGQRLNGLLARLETAFANRKQFLADASHELRTPVAALVTTLEVALRRRRDTDDYVKALDRCLSDARLLNQLVVALVEQARVEQFGRLPELGPTAIAGLLRDCVRQLQPLASSRDLALTCDLPEEQMLLADEQMLRSCVGNLLSNAIEYTPEGRPQGGGQVVLAVELSPAGPGSELPAVIRAGIPEGVDAEPCWVRIMVKDNGPGIAEKHIANVFEPFYRADAARTGPESHLGLGLALVRSYVRGLGGECRVQSPPPGEGAGCLFTLELPTVKFRSENNEDAEVKFKTRLLKREAIQ